MLGAYAIGRAGDRYAPRSIYTGVRDDFKVREIAKGMQTAYWDTEDPPSDLRGVADYCARLGVQKVADSYIVCNYTTEWWHRAENEGRDEGVVYVFEKDSDATAQLQLWQFQFDHPRALSPFDVTPEEALLRRKIIRDPIDYKYVDFTIPQS
jgi:hypothetical protein